MPEERDFFVSYTGADKKWAEWIAWIMEEAGYTTLIQAWDFKAASNFVLKMHSGATDTSRTVAILTPDYFKSAFTQPEWAAAFADDPKSEHGKLIAVRVADFEPPGLFKAIVYIDLVGLDETAAKEILIKSVGSIVTGKRLKPDSKPAFPEAKSSATHAPFPGTTTCSNTFLHNLPFNPNPFFTGRDKMLDNLHLALQQKTAAAITQPQAVHGLGGVGKTQLAIEYAWKFQADYDAVFWAGASSSAELHARMAMLATVLNLPEKDVKEQEIKVQAVMGWLRSHTRWLLMLDNADTKEVQDAILTILPPGLHGHVIVTSRIADWPVGYNDLVVSILPENAAKEFLLKRAHKGGFNPGNEADALSVAKELGFLPLALEQAGAYIARHRVSFAAYLKLLKEIHTELMIFPSQGGTGYQKTVATTWLVSEQQLSSTARAVLRMAAFLAPDDVPRTMFSQSKFVVAEAATLFARETNAQKQSSSSKQHIQDALAELAEHSLIELEEETFSCHRLLQAVQLDRLNKEDRQKWAERTLALVNEYVPFDSSDVHNSQIWDVISPHVSTLVEELWEQVHPDVAGMMNRLGVFLHTKALFTDSERLKRRSLAIAEKYYGLEHTKICVYLNNLGILLQETNRVGEAVPLMRRALSIEEKTYGPEDPSVFLCLNNLAHVLQANNQLNEAEPLMRRALALAEKKYGEENPAVALCLNNLAQLFSATGRKNEAEPMMRRALAINEIKYGLEHPTVANDLTNLAIVLKDTNRVGEAEPMMRRSLAIMEKSFGPEHPAVALHLNNLAQLLGITNRLAESEPLIRRALVIVEKTFGLEHPRVSECLNNLVFILMDKKQMGEAERLMRRALAIDEKSLGPDHPTVAIHLHNLSMVLIAMNRLGQAEPLMKRHVLIFKHFYLATGHEHPHWKAAVLDYRNLLLAMKMSQKQIDTKLREVAGN